MMVRDTLAGTTVEPSQNHTAPTQNQDGTQQLPGKTLEHVEQQNQLLELENLELLGQENEVLEQQNLEQQIQLLELENTVQTSTDNLTRPPDKTSSGGPLHLWWSQQSSFRTARPNIPLPWPSPRPCLLPIPLPWPSPRPCLLPIPLPCLRLPLHLPDPIPDYWTTHLRPFFSQQEYVVVRHTHRQLVHSGYYWGPMEMEEAHRTLLHTPPGSFLIRDSSQPDVFFTLSYHGDQGPISVRVLLTSQRFRLNGSNKAFDSLFALLRFYMESSHRRLRRAWRRERPMTLQQLCRGRIIELYGAERINSLPELNQVVTQYLQDYPYSI
ncbi:suppressor of cytokine signaling 1 [Salmo salar]|uniref:Suppressor of cytokine signaling 1 n=1 Tax=Salmo salar TaxID=8030 RepID=A0A1S3L395_SALSA|nr:suppressor of cytokine signaling 1-like [Salmo salar]|eukprot:XP_013985432.1 PREDICTED: suppressor of cytokine signaling 1-like [Salmo salar]